MARKSVQTAAQDGRDNAIQEALEDWKGVTEIRYEIAKAAYDYQDEETRAVLDRIVSRLRIGAGGYIRVTLNPPFEGTFPVKIEQEYLDFNLLYVATEILKDLALFDIRVANYKFPPSFCTDCGAEIVQESKVKGRRRTSG